MINISIPVAGSLKKTSGWRSGDEDGSINYIFRYHMLFRQRQSKHPIQMGERLRMFSSPKGETTKIIESVATTERFHDFESTLTRHFTESNQMEKISSEIVANFGCDGLGKLRGGLKTWLSSSLKKGVTQEKCINRSVYEERTHTITVERNISENVTKDYVVPAYYQQGCLDGYLTYVDYLFVKYERRGFQVRRRRVKEPSATNKRGREDHDNVIKTDNLPLCCIKYWSPLPMSKWIEERKYKLEIESPNDITVDPPEREFHGFSQRLTDVPSLYDLSEDAFPPRYEKDILSFRAA